MSDYVSSLEKVTMSVEGETFDIVAASFRGVPFFVDNYSQGGLGRTIATKKIPFSNRFVHEDLGGNVPTHSMSIYFVGEDCDIQKQKLIDACSKEGAAEFVHPYLGKFKARVSQLSFSATRSELGYVKGQITIEQEDTIPSRSVSLSLRLKVKNDAALFRSGSKNKFVEAFKTTKKYMDKAVASSEAALDAISDSRRSLSEVNEFVNEIGKLKANIDIILQSPADFANRLENLFTATASMFGYDVNKKDEVNEYISIIGLDDDSDVGRLNRNMAAAQMCDSLVDVEFISIDDADAYHSKVSMAFDTMLNDTDNIDDFLFLNGLQSSALTYLEDTMQNLAVIVEKEVKASCNILSLAFDVYGDIDRAEEIMQRNGLSQGLFVTPQKLKVLSR